jgi:hypothetical protein
MARIYDPAHLSHARLREFAVVAAWISSIVVADEDLEDLLTDVPPEERVLPDFSIPWPRGTSVPWSSHTRSSNTLGKPASGISRSWSLRGSGRTRNTGRCFA